MRPDPLQGLVRDAAEGILGCDAVTVSASPEASCYRVILERVTHEVCITPGFMCETFAGRRYWALLEAMRPLLQRPAPGRIVLTRDDVPVLTVRPSSL